jgi:hypothetical protein
MLRPYSYYRILRVCALTGILFAGCTKTADISADKISTSVSDDANTIDLSTCKLRNIVQDVGDENESALFSYNKAGNPYSLLYANNGTGIPNHYFIYDSKNRLRQYDKRYATFTVEQHKYGYNANDQIVKDSMVSFEAGVHYESISTIEYDAMGRVIKETIVNTVNNSAPLEATRRPTYTYDSRGNLAVAGWKSSSYDYKINPLRQSNVFQFIHRNYSMNNAAVQAKYNSKGLPLSANPSNDYFFNSPVTYKMSYDCL